MAKVQTIIELSEEAYRALSSHGYTKELIAKESRELLALKLFQNKVLTLRKSAIVAQMSLWEFIEFLGKNRIPVINYDESNLQTELKNANLLANKTKK